MRSGNPAQRALPILATACACAYLASLVWPGLLLFLATVLPVAACSLVLIRRRPLTLRLSLVAIAGWLAIGIAGAWLLRDHTISGLLWLLVALFLLPLPAIPWLYSRTFSAPDDAAVFRPTAHGPQPTTSFEGNTP